MTEKEERKVSELIFKLNNQGKLEAYEQATGEKSAANEKFAATFTVNKFEYWKAFREEKEAILGDEDRDLTKKEKRQIFSRAAVKTGAIPNCFYVIAISLGDGFGADNEEEKVGNLKCVISVKDPEYKHGQKKKETAAAGEHSENIKKGGQYPRVDLGKEEEIEDEPTL